MVEVVVVDSTEEEAEGVEDVINFDPKTVGISFSFFIHSSLSHNTSKSRSK